MIVPADELPSSTLRLVVPPEEMVRYIQDLMKLPHGGQMGSLKMSIVTGATELPMYTPSSRTRSATASGGGGGGAAGDEWDDRDDCHGWATTTATPTTAATTTPARPTHSQGLRLFGGA